MNAFAVVSDSGTLPEESCFFTSDGHHNIPVPDDIEENVSTKVVEIIQSYVGIANTMV